MVGTEIATLIVIFKIKAIKRLNMHLLNQLFSAPFVRLKTSQPIATLLCHSLNNLKKNGTLSQLLGLLVTAYFLIFVYPITGLDQTLIAPYFDMTEHRFTLKHDHFLEQFMHLGLKYCMVAIALTSLMIALRANIGEPSRVSLFIRFINFVKNPYFLAFFGMAISTTTISIFKSMSVHGCPSNLSLYGGNLPLFSLFAHLPAGVQAGHCFPGGHASAGFALMAFYFAFQESKPYFARAMLLLSLVVGFAMGWVQMMRGAHFMSHNLWSAWLVWLVLFVLFTTKNNLEKIKISFGKVLKKLVFPFQQTSNQSRGVLLVTAFIMLTGNFSLFERIIKLYPLNLHHLPFLISITLFFSILCALFFLLISHGKSARWVLALFLIIASQTAYYMDKFGVIVDVVMIDNILQTNAQEFAGLLTSSLVLRTILLGLIPAYLVIKFLPTVSSVRAECMARLKLAGVLVLATVLLILPFTLNYFTFWREHKITRFYANPTYATYSVIKFATQQVSMAKQEPLKMIAQDALMVGPSSIPELMIMVVGETARADRFSLNGYQRETNPLLVKQDVLSLSNVSSCGTSTSVSVPCMFSALGRKGYDKEKALGQENALDVLSDHGVEILWRDNNSDSKGVATRIQYENFKSPSLNPVCEGECRDIGMLNGLEQYIKARKGKDILIVLHQMGNHGPEYYRRYPKEFEKFKPICMTGELQDCTKEEVDNTYDNAILYTDYFLSQVIDLLKKYDASHATAMLYVSDHGESLGEHGFYLHAAPYMVAPKEQTLVPAIVWMGKHFDYNKAQLQPLKNAPLSHDDVFCSLLVTFEVDAKMCATKEAMLQQNLTFKAH